MFAFTETVHFTTSPVEVEAEIVAVPADLPVTLPFLSTAATFVLLEDHLLTVAFDTESFWEKPFVKTMLLWLITAEGFS